MLNFGDAFLYCFENPTLHHSGPDLDYIGLNAFLAPGVAHLWAFQSLMEDWDLDMWDSEEIFLKFAFIILRR